VAKAGEVDLGLVMGGGFGAFHGGLLRLADTLGPARLLSELRDARERWGMRFSPSSLLSDLARTGRTFYQAFP
jgi:3-hydroxyacyl-CoA dehydrogenase/enoyl-CoA hydratase/3-hydroxybutyryl-CoA epimerase